MCDPLTLVGVATTLGSTAVNYAAQQKVENARNDALAAERIRQQALNHEADAVNVGSRDRYKNFGDKQQHVAGKLQKYFTNQKVQAPQTETALPASNSELVVSEENKQLGQAKDFTDRTGDALGQLRSFGDLLGSNSLLQARDAGTVGQIGDFKAGSSNVLPLELDEASHAGDGLHMFGDLLNLGGGLALQKGLSTPANSFKPTSSLGAVLGGTQLTTPAVSMAPALSRQSALKYGGLSSLYGVP